jgi:hypothetical protein
MIQHDMMLWDHGMPRADGTRAIFVSRAAARSRRQHRVPVQLEDGGRSRRELAWFFHAANAKYATDYPARSGRT